MKEGRMLVAVEGCAHGELEHIYKTIKAIEERDDIKVDLLLCCGDFQATRNSQDLLTMAVPRKYERICSFYKYKYIYISIDHISYCICIYVLL